jgi:hypothetical protein
MTDDATLHKKLQEISDRQDILDLIHRYARGIDRRDRAMVRSVYHDDGVDDHAVFCGPVEEFLDWAFAVPHLQTWHQHYLTNHTVELDGDRAHTETYYLFVATDADPTKPLQVVGGRYLDRLERREGRWGIVLRVCLMEWMSESPSLVHGPLLDFLRPLQTVSHDRSDQSYDRPLVVKREQSA